MLKYDTAKELFEKIQKSTDECGDEMVLDFYHEFLKKACNYAKIRADWTFWEQNTRNENDSGRTNIHNGFIDSLNIVCRCLNIQGVDEILPDRKYKGDFACYIALFLALEQR